MKKMRRIEITAFRRQVNIYSGDEQRKNANDIVPSPDESRPNNNCMDRLTIDLEEGCDDPLNAARTSELVLLAEALLDSKGKKKSVAARRLRLSKSGFNAKLRSLGLSMRNLGSRKCRAATQRLIRTNLNKKNIGDK